MRGILWGASLALALAAPAVSAALGPTVLHFDTQFEWLALQSPSDWSMRKALLRVNASDDMTSDRPFLTIEGGTITAYQYWQNATMVYQPLTGDELTRVRDVKNKQPIDFSPTQITLLRSDPQAEIRFTVSSLATAGLSFPGVGQATVAALAPLDAVMGPARAAQVDLGELQEFNTPPSEAGWVSFRPSSLYGNGRVGLLIDGWHVELSDHRRTETLETGLERHPLPGLAAAEREVYSFVVLWIDNARLFLQPGFGRFEGYAPSLQIDWNGVAHVEALGGSVASPELTAQLARRPITLEGEFQGVARFPTDAALAGGAFEGDGRGTSTALLDFEQASLATFLPGRAGLWAGVVLGAITVGALGAHTIALPRRPRAVPSTPPAGVPPPTPPTPAANDVEGLMKRVRDQPFDGGAHFQLAMELLRRGEVPVAVRHLDRSFRLAPDGILRLLEDPQYAPVRERSEVRQVLARIHREQQRRIWAGYA